jgi:hypothetical protein
VTDIESSSHTFVIRIWLESRDPPAWRGHVTHVITGDRREFADLQQLVQFVAGYLNTERPDAR